VVFMNAVDTVAVRGTGSIGLRHLRVLHALGARVAAMPVRSTRSRATDLEGFLVAESWEAAWRTLGSPTRWGAIIATDTSRHLDDAREALRAGATVLVEKPLAPTAAGLAALERDARNADRRVYVACNLRFSTGLRWVRDHLTTLGRPYAARIECQSYLPSWRPGTDYRQGYAARVNEGGVMRDLVHEIDYAVWLFGRPTDVTATLGNTGELNIETEETADLLWTTPGGTVVSVRLDYLSRVPRRRLYVTAEGGTLEWDAISQQVTVQRAGTTQEVVNVSQERDAMMADQARAFLRAAGGSDSEGALATLEEGAFAVALMDAARSASERSQSKPIHDWRST
jgi:predicted dehydrogenase